MERETHRDGHLSDGEFFTLAVPPAGEPEALPRHLSECLACSRALSEWKTAVRDLRERDTDVLSRRTTREWEALEERTLQAIRGARIGRRSRRLSWWAVTIAASVLLFAVAVPLSRNGRRTPVPATLSAQFTKQDQEDDLLLRDVARLSRGDEGSGGSWSSLAPEPDTTRSEEERL